MRNSTPCDDSRQRQLSLFDVPKRQPDLPPPPSNSSPTSKAAADSIAAHASTLRARILRFIAGQGSHGATNEDVSLSLGISIQTTTPRTTELKRLGLIRKAGERATSTGRAAAVLVATHQGKEALRC